MWTYNHTDELYHYGVKGMKWGVRKDRAYRYSINEKGETIIKKGSNIHRATVNPNDEKTGHAYASFTEGDIVHYNRTMVGYLTEISRGTDPVTVYDMTMKVTKDLISPSERTKVYAFMDMMENRKLRDLLYDNAESIIDSDKDSFRFTTLSKGIEDLGLPPKVSNIYAAFSMGMYKVPELRDEFFSRLKEQGYNMIIDTEDAVIEAEVPIIVFNRDETLKTLKVTKLPKKFSPGYMRMMEADEQRGKEYSKNTTEWKKRQKAVNTGGLN